jgi:acetyl-CoA acetyltransferase
MSPAQMFGLSARRHMHLYGTTIDHFAEVTINARMMAANNPLARFRDPITVEEHHASRLMADPIRKLDMCMESDVGVAVLITSAERARDLRRPPVLLRGATLGSPWRWGQGNLGNSNMRDEDFASAGQRSVAEDLYAKTGLGPGDVDVAQIYDHFTPMVIMGLEEFGFCAKGEGGPFVADGNIRMTGSLPLNTSGGNLAEVYSHGMTHVVEGVRQLRGTSCNQVEGAEVCLVVGGAGPTPTSALMLRRSS